MHFKFSDSSGIVPLSKIDGEWEVFLINHREFEQYWGCPKGHLEPNENPELAARRELKEETGLEVKRLLQKEPLLEEFYWFKNNQCLLKRILFYVAEVEGNVDLQADEIAGGQWFSLPQAIQKVAHPEGKETLKQVQEILLQSKRLSPN